MRSLPSPNTALSSDAPGRTNRGWCWVGLAVACVFLANTCRVEADADLWGHLRFGLESLSAGKLAATDPYSYTAFGAAWTNHEWLAEGTFAACYRAAGPLGLVLLRAFLLAGCIAAVGVLAIRRKLSAEATLALAVFGMTLLAQFYRVRPQMFTYTAFAWLIALCDRHQPGRRWGLCVLPPLFALWCNLHAGFVAGLGIFGFYWCQFAWDARRHPQRNREWSFLAAIFLAVLAATLVNPYGIAYWRYVLFAVTLPRPAITEWASVWVQHPVVWSGYLVTVLVPAFCWLGSSRRGAAAETLAFLLVACLAARHARHLPFALILGAAVFARRWPEFHFDRTTRDGTHWFHTASMRLGAAFPARFALLLLVLAAVAGGTAKLSDEVAAAGTEGVVTVRTDRYPVAAVSFLKQQHIGGNLYCDFNWGEYCIWHLSPQCRVFCDGRYETVYPREISRLALSKLAVEADQRAVIEQFPTEILLVPSRQPFAAWLANREDFQEIYCDQTARLFLKRATQAMHLPVPAAANVLKQAAPGNAVPFP